MTADACDSCLARAWLLGRLAGHLERLRSRIGAVLELPDEELLAALAPGDQDEIQNELIAIDPARLRHETKVAGLELVCRCHPSYPRRLLDLTSPPAILYAAGGIERLLELLAQDPVAIVGARRATDYGTQMARSLGRGLASAGVTVLSGMAFGIDCAAHLGALDVGGATLAVLPGPANRPYPSSKRELYRRIVAGGCAISELPPGAAIWRWAFPARNRIIAALAAMTVVAEAGSGSGALLTARSADGIGRPVGAVPGRVTTAQAAGPNELLATGAHVVRGAQDVLDHLYGAGVRSASDTRQQLEPDLQLLLDAIAQCGDTQAALTRAGLTAEQGLARLATLELAGYIRRSQGGRFSVVP